MARTDKIFCVLLAFASHLSLPTENNRGDAVDLFFRPPTERVLDRKTPLRVCWAWMAVERVGQDLPAMRNHWTVTSRKTLDARTEHARAPARSKRNQKEEEEEEFTGRLRSSHKSQSHTNFIYRGLLLFFLMYIVGAIVYHRPSGGAYLTIF